MSKMHIQYKLRTLICRRLVCMIDYAFIGARLKEARIRKNMTQEQLADYLGVERSGLSLELGKMRDEGLLDFHKSHFILKV